MTREELVNCARWEGMAPTNEAAQDATECALMLLALHAYVDTLDSMGKPTSDERPTAADILVANIRHILGRDT